MWYIMYLSRISFLIFHSSRLCWLAFCWDLWVLAGLCIHLIHIYIIFLSLWVCKNGLVLVQYSVLYNAYFKIGWPKVHVMMNLLMKFFWNLNRLCYQGTSSVNEAKRASLQRKAHSLLSSLSYCFSVSFQPKRLYLKVRNKSFILCEFYDNLLTLLYNKMSFFSITMFHLLFF